MKYSKDHVLWTGLTPFCAMLVYNCNIAESITIVNCYDKISCSILIIQLSIWWVKFTCLPLYLLEGYFWLPKNASAHTGQQWFNWSVPSKIPLQGQRKQPGDGPTKLSTIPRITGTQASRVVWGHAPRKFLKIRCPNMLFFSTFSLLAWKIYCTLHSKYKQHKMSVYKMTTWKKKNFFLDLFFLQLLVRTKPEKLDCFRWPCTGTILCMFNWYTV